MHHYCVVIAKTTEAERQLLPRLERFTRDRLTFEPDELVLHRASRRTFVFSLSAAQSQIGIDTPVHLSADESCLVGGLPTFERFAQYRPSTRMRPAAWICELLRDHAPSELYTNLGGTYSTAHIHDGQVTAFGSFSGLDSLFYIDNALYAAVGNRPGLVASFQPAGAHSAIDPWVLSWVLSTTMIIGDETPWLGVRRLRTDEVLSIGQGGVRTSRVDIPAYVLPEAEHADERHDAAVERLVKRFEWYLGTDLRFTAHLTGGKDSRLVLALLSAAGSIDRVDEIVTNGSEENGDVIVARQIAAQLGLGNHVVREGAKPAVRSADWPQYAQRFRFSPWKYDMYLTPYDGWGHAAVSPSATTTLTGNGGEIIRQMGVAPEPSTEGLKSVVERFTHWQYRHDALGILAPEARQWQRSRIRVEIAAMIDAGVVNLQQRFHVEHRVANWGNAHFRNNGASSLAALIDIDLARLMQLRADMADDLPYEILTRRAPQLLRIPFTNDEWQGRTGERARLEGTFRAPVEAAIAKSFPWQFALYRDHRDDLVRRCIASLDAWQGVVEPDGLEQLLARPLEPFNSTHVKMLFGLVAGTNYLAGDLARERDFASTSNRLVLKGSEVSSARSWFDYRVADRVDSITAH